MTTNTKKKRLPDFDKMSQKEEANWWETHDTSGYADKFTVGEPFKIEPGALKAPKELRELSRKLVAENMDSALNIRLTKRAHNEPRILARKKGIGIATLAGCGFLKT